MVSLWQLPHLSRRLLNIGPWAEIWRTELKYSARASKVTFDAAACAGTDNPAKGLPEAAAAGVSEMPAKGLLPALANAFPPAVASSGAGTGAGAAPRLALKIFRFLIAVLSARAKPSPISCCTACRLFRPTYSDFMRAQLYP